jgi:hypothetical protein
VLVDERSTRTEFVAEGRTRGQALDVDGVTRILLGGDRVDVIGESLGGALVEVEIVDALEYDLIARVIVSGT